MVRVLDLRPERADAPDLEFVASPAAELLRIAAVLVDEDLDDFDVGEDRLAAMRGQLDDALTADLDAVGMDGKGWLLLSVMVAELPRPGRVDDLLDRLAEEPRRSWRALAATELHDVHVDGAEDLAEALVCGRAGYDDVAALVAVEERTDALRMLLDMDPDAHGRAVLAGLRGLAEVAGAWLAEAEGPMRREVAGRSAELAAGADVGDLVVRATNGYELSDTGRIDRVLLLPSYWFRPWIIVARHLRTEVITTPIADEHLALPSQAPPPALVKLFKALGDEGRLRLLRRMTGGAITLDDAMDELGVAKTTAHHHLSILRQAGLVSISEDGRRSRYGLREDPPAAAGEALAAYVGPVLAHVLDAPATG